MCRPWAVYVTVMDERRRVLLVEDDRDTREVIAELLELLGHECRSVGSARSALEALAAFEPNLVLLDIGLPDMNGHELAREVRARCRRDVIIAAVTGHVQPSDVKRSFEAGINEHLAKPIGAHALRRLIERARTCEPASV